MASSVQGYQGRVLRVDLTSERLEDEVNDAATMRKLVGGIGLGAKVTVDSYRNLVIELPSSRRNQSGRAGLPSR